VQSLAQYREMWEESVKRPDRFWAREGGRAEVAAEMDEGARLAGAVCPVVRRRQAERCGELSRPSPRHARQNKAALIWEGEPGEKRVLTYQQLYREVCRFANVLKRNKVRKGDRVLIYMPMIPEAAVAMLAVRAIGATHSVVFGGFSADSIRDRIADSKATLVITADGGYRRGSIVR
jgi:acetyl-CoA synthetase